jgi:CarD family transcriptional regulator
MEHLRTGDIKEVAGVVRNLLRIERSKPLSTGEKKMLTNARQILTSELVLVLGRAESDVQDMIEQVV